MARDVIRDIGWNAQLGYDPNTIKIEPHYSTQSPDIAQGVELNGKSIGAGDQGITGYAVRNSSLDRDCDDNLPLAASLSRSLLMKMETVAGITKL